VLRKQSREIELELKPQSKLYFILLIVYHLRISLEISAEAAIFYLIVAGAATTGLVKKT
jgi:hypothetical protein